MHRIVTALFLAVVLHTGGCDRAAPSAGLLVRDSAGTRIIEFDRDRVQPAFVIAAEPTWVVGSPGELDSGLLLHDIRDALLLDEDHLVIAEGSTQELIHVTPLGGEYRRSAGSGGSEAEFLDLARIFDLGGARLGVFDRGRQRYVELDGSGTVTMARELGDEGVGRALAMIRTGDGTLYLSVPHLSIPVGGSGRSENRLLRLRSPADGPGSDTVGVLFGPEVGFGRDRAAYGRVLFGADGLIAADREGVWIADTAEQEVRFLTGGPAPDRLVRWSTSEPREMTEEKRSALWAQLAAGLPDEERAMLTAMREMAPQADTVPALGAILVDAVGRLWIGEHVGSMEGLESPHPRQDWVVLDLLGGSVGRVDTPDGLRLLRAGAAYVLGVHRDELGVETVRRHELRGLNRQ